MKEILFFVFENFPLVDFKKANRLMVLFLFNQNPIIAYCFGWIVKDNQPIKSFFFCVIIIMMNKKKTKKRLSKKKILMMIQNNIRSSYLFISIQVSYNNNNGVNNTRLQKKPTFIFVECMDFTLFFFVFVVDICNYHFFKGF